MTCTVPLPCTCCCCSLVWARPRCQHSSHCTLCGGFHHRLAGRLPGTQDGERVSRTQHKQAGAQGHSHSMSACWPCCRVGLLQWCLQSWHVLGQSVAAEGRGYWSSSDLTTRVPQHMQCAQAIATCHMDLCMPITPTAAALHVPACLCCVSAECLHAIWSLLGPCGRQAHGGCCADPAEHTAIGCRSLCRQHLVCPCRNTQ